MAWVREYMEYSFERLARGLYQHPFKVLVILSLVVLILSSKLPSISIDTSTEGMLQQNDPVLLEYDRFREQFGQEEIIILAIQSPENFNADFLSKLKSLHHDLENEIPHLKEVYSLMNATRIYNQGDTLFVEANIDVLTDGPREGRRGTITPWQCAHAMRLPRGRLLSPRLSKAFRSSGCLWGSLALPGWPVNFTWRRVVPGVTIKNCGIVMRPV